MPRSCPRSTVAATETVWSQVTKSSLTATRESKKYTRAQFKAGFGTDVSFDTLDKNGVRTELGVAGMVRPRCMHMHECTQPASSAFLLQAHTGDGNGTADFIVRYAFARHSLLPQLFFAQAIHHLHLHPAASGMTPMQLATLAMRCVAS